MPRAVKWIALFVTVVWCFFIWHFSLAPAVDSSRTSQGITERVNKAISGEADRPLSHHTVRKTAHFCEYAVLGFLASLTLFLFGFAHRLLFALLAVFPVAAADELLQCLSPGRGPSFADVMLDTTGGFCGALLFGGIMVLISAVKRAGKRKSDQNIPKNP